MYPSFSFSSIKNMIKKTKNTRYLLACRIFCIFIMLLFFSQNIHSEKNVSIKIYYIPFEMESPYSISPTEFDRLYANNCDSIILSNSLAVNTFLAKIECLHDTIIENHTPDKIYKSPNGEQAKIQLYPRIDTRGKIEITYLTKNVILYFSKFKLWNSTDDVIFRLSKELRNHIQQLFRGNSIHGNPNGEKRNSKTK